MFGADIERVLGVIDRVYVASQNASKSLAGVMDRQLFTMIDGRTVTDTPGSHGHPDGSHSHEVKQHRHYEDSVPRSKPEIPSGELREELKKLSVIQGKLYTATTSLNNSVGSPYTELTRLMVLIEDYLDAPGSMVYLGQHAAAAALAQRVTSGAIDAKYAVIHYHDGLQRGYDTCLNGGRQSITWDDFRRGETTGNVT